MRLSQFPYLIQAVWAVLALAIVTAVLSQHWSNVFVTVTAFLLTLLPLAVSKRLDIKLPAAFLVGIVLFVFATLFLGEVFDFYERFWWWDILLHGSSAIGVGIVGFVFVFYLFEGDKYAAPPWALAAIAFALAVALGVIWEIFEFGMDQIFGLNMQKSGLVDTMTDLIVDAVGAAIAAVSGFFWLKGRQVGVAGMIEEFVQLNRKGFRKLRDRAGSRWHPGARGRD